MDLFAAVGGVVAVLDVLSSAHQHLAIAAGDSVLAYPFQEKAYPYLGAAFELVIVRAETALADPALGALKARKTAAFVAW